MDEASDEEEDDFEDDEEGNNLDIANDNNNNNNDGADTNNNADNDNSNSKKSTTNLPKKGTTRKQKDSIDWLALQQTELYSIAASCLCIGFKYASTADAKARDLITSYIFRVRSTPRTNIHPARLASLPNAHSNEVDRYTLDFVLGILALSLALVMAGTGELHTFGLLRVLRKKADRMNTNFGTLTAVHLAIGLLFLGGCKKKFSNKTPFAVACMLLAFFPKFPIAPTDNRFHLQALRHLYALATEDKEEERSE